MGMGAQQAGETTTTTNSTASPWGPIQPYLQNIYSNAQKLQDNNPLSYYGGEQVAPFTPESQQAFSGIKNYASGGGSGVNAANEKFLTNTLNSDNSQFAYNPMNANDIMPGGKLFNANLQAASNEILPNVQSAFGTHGGAQNSGLSQELLKQMSQAFAGQAMNAYALQQQGGLQNKTNMLNAQGDQLRASALGPTIDQSAYANLGALAGVGDVQQQQKQKEIEAQMQKYNFNQMAPYQQAQLIAGLITGANPNTPSQTGTQSTPYYENPMGDLLGLGLKGASIYSGLGGLGGAGAFAGASAGASGGSFPFF